MCMYVDMGVHVYIDINIHAYIILLKFLLLKSEGETETKECNH